MTKSKFIKSLYFVVPILLVAIIGSIFVNMGMEWYNSLTKPSQWLPSFVIPLMWTIIYALFVIALYDYQNNKKFSTYLLILLCINGILNIVWCLTFFALKLTFVGNVVIIINLIASFLLQQEMQRQKQEYRYLLVYPIWVSIATTLNIALWILN